MASILKGPICQHRPRFRRKFNEALNWRSPLKPGEKIRMVAVEDIRREETADILVAEVNYTNNQI